MQEFGRKPPGAEFHVERPDDILEIKVKLQA